MAGGMGLVAQLALTGLVRRIMTRRQRQPPQQQWRNDNKNNNSNNATDLAGYTAHTLVALVFMMLVSGMGIVGYWIPTAAPSMVSVGGSSSSTGSRLLAQSDAARWLAAVVWGMLTLWDLPTSLILPSLRRKPDVIGHHIVMTLIAYTAAIQLPLHCVYFYLGVSELSSVPLLVYDQFDVLTKNNNNSWTNDANLQRRLLQWRDFFQIAAAVSFTVVRALLFPVVTLFQFVPDVLRYQGPPNVVQLLRWTVVASLGFTALQLYWFSKMVRVMRRNPAVEVRGQ